MAIGQPLLSTLGNNPSFFLARGSSARHIVLLAFVIIAAPPLALWATTEALRRVQRTVGAYCFNGLIGILIGILAVQLLKRIDLAGIVVAVLSAATALGAAAVHWRYKGAARWLRFVSVLAAAALATFIFASDSSALINGDVVEPAVLDVVDPLPDLFILVLDELPTATLLDESGNIDGTRFPNLAEFAATSTWYRHQTTMSPFTESAIPSLLTGTTPQLRPAVASEFPDNLFTLFGNTHQLVVSEALTQLCGVPACATGISDSEIPGPATAAGSRLRDLVGDSWSLFVTNANPFDDAAPSFGEFEESIDSNQPDVAGSPTTTLIPAELDRFIAVQAESQPTRFVDFLDRLRPSAMPVFGFLHLVTPHQPWRYYGNGDPYWVPDSVDEGIEFLPSEWLVRTNATRHVEQTRYADALVGEFLASLRTNDQFDDALIVIVADHGIDFEPGTRPREISEHTIDGVAYTPLLIKYPRQAAGSISDENLMSIDVVPTIAAAFGVTLPFAVDGIAAGSAAIGDRGTEKVYYDIVEDPDYRLEGVRTFDDEIVWPRLLTQRRTDLYATLDAAALIGTRPEVVIDPDQPLVAEIFDGATSRIESPPADEPLLGVLTGRVSNVAPDDIIVALFDGEVIGVSPVYDVGERDGNFAIWVPSGALNPAGAELQIASLTPSSSTKPSILGFVPILDD